MKITALEPREIIEEQTPATDINETNGLSSLVREGAFANVFVVLTGGAFLTGLALYMGASDVQIGILAAAPFLMQSAQLLSPFLFKDPVSFKNRIVTTLGISRILWLLIIPFILFTGSGRLTVLVGIVSLSGLLTMVSSPAWLSWIADVVPRNLRGRFFSRRNAAVAATTVAGTIIGSLILDWSRGHKLEDYGFSVIVLLAAAGALLAWHTMNRISAASGIRMNGHLPKPDLSAPFRNRTFRHLLIVFSAWNIAIGLAAAFFAPHMFINLKMSFFQVGIYTCVMALIGIVSSWIWGNLIDRFGSKPILNICAFGIGFIPLIWLFAQPDSLWILFPEAVYSGMLWAGFNVAAFTLPLDSSPRDNRTLFLSVFAALTGLAFFASSILGGVIAGAMSGWSYVLFDRPLVNYHLLFIVSAVMRLLTAGLIAYFHEPSEIRLPVVIQLMGYAVLKRMSVGRQLFPFTNGVISADNNQKNFKN